MLLIAISGAARAGKDTLAKTIQALVPNTITLAFAQAVKEEADPISKARWGISAFTQNPEEKKIIRQLLIDIGHGKRQADPFIWINKLSAKIDENLPHRNIIITDCRYENESKMIHAKGGIVIMVKRDTQLDIPTERETLPGVDWDIFIDFKNTDTNRLMQMVIPSFQP
jgi:uridine kinase